MKKRILLVWVCLSQVISLASAGVVLSSLVSDPGHISVQALDQHHTNPAVTQIIEYIFPNSLPYEETIQAIHGDASAKVMAVLTPESFSFEFEFQSAGNPLGGDGSQGLGFYVNFQVSTPTHFVISGVHDSPSGSSNGGASFYASIHPYEDTDSYIYYTDQHEYTSNKGFLLGVDPDTGENLGGNHVNTQTGFPFGTLQPGVEYSLSLGAGSGPSGSDESGVRSDGYIRIDFSPAVMSWAGYFKDSNGFIDTESWLGQLYKPSEDDWMYSYVLSSWMYFPEPEEGNGGWSYIMR